MYLRSLICFTIFFKIIYIFFNIKIQSSNSMAILTRFSRIFLQQLPPLSILLVFAIFFNSCKTPSKPVTDYASHKTVIADKAVVSAAHPLASQVGLAIMQQGGNAVDAAIAVQFALAVVYPRAGNLGGGGFMVYRSGDGKDISTLDYREKAPAKAFADMYLDDKKNVIEGKSQRGHLAAGVPGTVDGCRKMFEKYSKLKDWKKLVQPAIDLAEIGFGITQSEANRLNEQKINFLTYNSNPVVFVQKDTSIAWKKGDILRQHDLAETLERIRDKGEAGFYEGKTADLIVAEMQRGNGFITKEDLKNYESAWRKPLLGKYRGYGIITMPPPSSGGIALLQLLGTMENYPLSKYGFHSVEATHLIVEAERRAYADRAEFLGDPDFWEVPTRNLFNPKYLVTRMGDFNP